MRTQVKRPSIRTAFFIFMQTILRKICVLRNNYEYHIHFLKEKVLVWIIAPNNKNTPLLNPFQRLSNSSNHLLHII